MSRVVEFAAIKPALAVGPDVVSVANTCSCGRRSRCSRIDVADCVAVELAGVSHTVPAIAVIAAARGTSSRRTVAVEYACAEKDAACACPEVVRLA